MACEFHAPDLSDIGCTTVQGRLITYQLRVIQQPEPFADRRLIDPPPVVQLRTIESFSSPSAGEHDVTFDNNAQCFLLVTIEPLHRQNIGHSSSGLTGDRFANIARVRRPYPAGYFIFSDLAMRTAGQYHLKFSLFEKYTSAGSDG
ncbi:sexual development activator, partial [Penicillium frequentans]